MPGTYSITSRASGSLLTAAIYNEDHAAHLTFNTPGGMDDYSVNVAQMQSSTDPGESGTESLPTDLAGELQRLRFSLAELKTFIDPSITYWFQTPTAASVLLKSLADAKGDLLAATAADTIAKLTVGSNGGILMARSYATSGLAYVAALNKYVHGLTFDVGTDATNDININTGGCMDATGAYWMSLSTALGKQSDQAWAVGGTTGTPLGFLDTGAVGNSDYYIWLIARSDTGVVDALCSLSSTAPTMPASYDFKRLIGWFKRVGGTVVAFRTYETEGGGIEFLWDAPTLDINLANTLNTGRRTDAIKVPLGFATNAHINVQLTDAAAGAYFAWIGCPDHTDAAPSQTVAPLANIAGHSTGGIYASVPMWIRTSSTGTIAARASVATVDLYAVSTIGFRWDRRA